MVIFLFFFFRQAIANGEAVLEHVSSVYNLSPVLGRLLSAYGGGSVPPSLRELLALVTAKARAAFPDRGGVPDRYVYSRPR